MKKQPSSFSLTSERLAYRRAVRLCLKTFFEKSSCDAKELVDVWWSNIGRTPIWQTGIFMHDEPMNTAARLANQVVPAISEYREKYEELLASAMPKQRSNAHKYKKYAIDRAA